MSRLEKHRQKKIITYTGILLGLIIFFIFFGLPLFIRGSVFLSDLFGGGQSDTSNRNQAFRDIQIATIPEATNSASFVVSGTVNNFDILEFYVNDDKVEEKDVKDEDSFSQELSSLQAGENEFFILAKVKGSSDKKRSDIYTVVFKNSKPKLEISEPTDNLKTNKTEIKVAGATDSDAEVKINSIPIVLDPKGNFQTLLKLNNGDNKIVITAQDLAGNQEEKTLNVNYSPDN